MDQKKEKEKILMLIKPGQLSPKDKEKLSKNGYLVIEHSDPHFVKIIQPEENFAIKHKLVYTECRECAERIYITEERMNQLKKYHKAFYCSQGHGQILK